MPLPPLELQLRLLHWRLSPQVPPMSATGSQRLLEMSQTCVGPQLVPPELEQSCQGPRKAAQVPSPFAEVEGTLHQPFTHS